MPSSDWRAGFRDFQCCVLFFYAIRLASFLSFIRVLRNIRTSGYCIRNSFHKPAGSIIIDDRLVSNTTGRSVTRTIHTWVYEHAPSLLPQTHIAQFVKEQNPDLFFFFFFLKKKVTGEWIFKKSSCPLLLSLKLLPFLPLCFHFVPSPIRTSALPGLYTPAPDRSRITRPCSPRQFGRSSVTAHYLFLPRKIHHNTYNVEDSFRIWIQLRGHYGDLL